MPTFLLIGHRERLPWFEDLCAALDRLGKYRVMGPEKALRNLERNRYDLVIIDAAQVEKVLDVVTHLRTLHRQTRVMVIASTLTWRSVREVIQAGAMDYISKSMSAGEYLDALKSCLEKTAVP